MLKKPMLLQYHNIHKKSFIGHGLLLYGCNSENKLKPVFTLHKKILRKVDFKARYYPSTEIFFQTNVLIVYDFHTVELPSFFL